MLVGSDLLDAHVFAALSNCIINFKDKNKKMIFFKIIYIKCTKNYNK